jgi:hypothetical protein
VAEANFNYDEFRAGLASANSAVIEAARQAVRDFGEMVIGNAQELAPVETGALQGSGTAEDAKVEGNAITMVIGFNVDYAAARHERPPEHDGGRRQNPKGQWKFLQTAMQQLTPRFESEVGGRIKDATGGE